MSGAALPPRWRPRTRFCTVASSCNTSPASPRARSAGSTGSSAATRRVQLLIANRTGMPQPVAATAYLTLMTCPRVDARTVGALRAFRARRGNFGQDF